jgi:hypothetical protein
MSVADYMQEVLTNPVGVSRTLCHRCAPTPHRTACSRVNTPAVPYPTCQQGYYTRSGQFGSNGDFITAPGVSQIFGEVCGSIVA